MKSNVKIAPKSNVQTPVAVSEVAEELPAAAEPSTSKTQKTYITSDDVRARLQKPEELVDIGTVRAKVGVSKNGRTFLRFRRNGDTYEVYEADEGLVFPEGLVVNSLVNVRIDIRKNDKSEVKTLEDGRVYITLFAVNCEAID